MHTDLLTMLKCSPEIYGEEIQEIEEASDKYCINYFEKKLFNFFGCNSLILEKYVDITTTGKGDISSIKLKQSGFGLTKQRCIEIHHYIISKVRCNYLFKRPELDEYNCIIVYNYISKGWKLDGTAYNLKYKFEEKNNE